MKFAKISSVRPGDILQFGAGFPCIPAGETRTVKVNENAAVDAKRFGCFSDHHALYVDCVCGGHLLEAQIDFAGDNDSLVGIFAPGTITRAHMADKKNPLPTYPVRKFSGHVFDPERFVTRGLLRKCRGGTFELGPNAVTSQSKTAA
jgi:hypothetical protein